MIYPQVIIRSMLFLSKRKVKIDFWEFEEKNTAKWDVNLDFVVSPKPEHIGRTNINYKRRGIVYSRNNKIPKIQTYEFKCKFWKKNSVLDQNAEDNRGEQELNPQFDQEDRVDQRANQEEEIEDLGRNPRFNNKGTFNINLNR